MMMYFDPKFRALVNAVTNDDDQSQTARSRMIKMQRWMANEYVTPNSAPREVCDQFAALAEKAGVWFRRPLTMVTRRGFMEIEAR